MTYILKLRGYRRNMNTTGSGEQHGGQGNKYGAQAQLAQKTTLTSDSKLKEQELREQVHKLEELLRRYEKTACVTTAGTPYKGGNL